MALFNFVFVVRFALLNAEHLSSSRLAADCIGSACKNCSAGSLLSHILHGPLNKVHVFFLQRDHIDRILRHDLFFAGL